MNKKLLVASQPTRGVDIGAIESIRNTLEQAKKKGTGVLLVSAELEEIISLSDRIIVIHEGKITGEMEPARPMRTTWDFDDGRRKSRAECSCTDR